MDGLKIAYSYNASGYYIGETLVQADPMGTGYLMPPNTVLSGPGEIPSGKRAKWNGSTWVLESIPTAPSPTLPTTQELAAAAREKRTGMLYLCDWTQLPDVALTSAQKASWATYRQALRDVPQQTNFPTEINWPNEPTASA